MAEVVTIILIVTSNMFHRTLMVLIDYLRTIGPYQWKWKALKWLGGGCLITYNFIIIIFNITFNIYNK